MQPLAGQMDMEAGGEGAPVVLEITEEDLALIAEKEAQAREQLMARLDAMAQSLAKSRSEAIAARMASGIEDIWREDQEFYEGIDDANRGESKTLWRSKPPGQAAAQTNKPTRSTVFPNITAPYTDAAAARIADMLLPTDDRGWALKPEPIAELVGISEGKYGAGMLREAAAMYPGEPQRAQNALAKATRDALQMIAEAKEKADKAQKRIEDWHVECQFHAHVRQVIEDAARIGTGVLKGPTPVQSTAIAWKDGRLVKSGKVSPGSKRIDPWNFYPDAACGDSIHKGGHTWERDYLTKKQLRELREDPSYLSDQIDLCLAEGAQRATAEYKPTPDGPMTDPMERDRFEVWYYHGTAEREDIEAAGCDCSDEPDVYVPVMLMMVNNRVIKAALNPLETGEFPYDVFVWRRREGHWSGIGVARQIRVAQRIVTAATRNLMDNAGIAAGPMIVFRQGVVTPQEGSAQIGPRKVWLIDKDAEEMIDATKAIGVVKVDMLVQELMEIIQLGLKLAEDVTGLPMLLQGQMGKAPDTVGGMTMLNNNASAVLRRLARLFDDLITEPHVRRYYAYLLIYGQDDEKGSYTIDARGSSALVERDLQNQQIPQLLQASTNPVFGIDPKKTMREWLQSLHFDPKRFDFDDDKWKQIVENMAKGPNDPRLAVAQLRAEVEQRLQAADQAFEQAENERDRQLDVALKQLDNLATGAGLSAEQQNVLANIKKDLAKTVITTNTQKQLSREGAAASRMSKPPTEPKGRARPGQSFAH